MLGGIMAEERPQIDIRLDEEQHRVLSAMARCRGRSISELAGDLIRAHLDQFETCIQAQRLEALERVRGHRERIDPE